MSDKDRFDTIARRLRDMLAPALEPVEREKGEASETPVYRALTVLEVSIAVLPLLLTEEQAAYLLDQVHQRLEEEGALEEDEDV